MEVERVEKSCENCMVLPKGRSLACLDCAKEKVQTLEAQLQQSHAIIETMRKWVCDHIDCLICPVYHPNENQCDSLIDYILTKGDH